MQTYIYNIRSPEGEEFVGIESLEKFCKSHHLTYRRVAEAARANRPYRDGWVIDRILKSKTEYDKFKSYGLSTDERLNKAIEENTKLKVQLKNSERENGLIKILSGFVKETTPQLDIKPYIKCKKKTTINESAILLLSDLHADQDIRSNRVQDLECYNFDVACKRAERIVDTTVTHLMDNMSCYNFEQLYVFGLGDYVNGTIHGATEHSKWQNSIKNSMGTGELIAQMINDLSEHFPHITFVSVPGNHGRFTIKKDYRGAHNNWDYLVSTYAVSRLQNLVDSGKLSYCLPDSWSTGVKIYDWNFCLNHGDDIKGWNSLPYYGIERKTRRLSAIGAINNRTPHYYMYGHFHTSSAQAHVNGEVFTNGSWNATDEYALESLGAFSEPVQWLMGCHEKYGVSWRMPIKLRDHNWKENEKIVGRYDIKLP